MRIKSFFNFFKKNQAEGSMGFGRGHKNFRASRLDRGEGSKTSLSEKVRSQTQSSPEILRSNSRGDQMAVSIKSDVTAVNEKLRLIAEDMKGLQANQISDSKLDELRTKLDEAKADLMLTDDYSDSNTLKNAASSITTLEQSLAAMKSDSSGVDHSETNAALASADAALEGTFSNISSVLGGGSSSGSSNGRGAVTAGTQVRANTNTSYQVDQSDITGLENGGYVVTWELGDGDTGVRAQVYDADGSTVGDEIWVNTTVNGNQGRPSITSLKGGGFVISYEDQYAADGSGQAILAQVYDNSGNAVGDEFRVNTTTLNDQDEPAITALEDGGFAVAFVGGADGDAEEIYVQRYDADGSKVGGETRVNTYTSGEQETTDIVGLKDGGYVVTWESNANGHRGIYAQRFDANGDTVGGEFRINRDSGDNLDNPKLTALENGGFVATWVDEDEEAAMARVFDVNGRAITNDMELADGFDIDNVDVAALADGSFVVTYDIREDEGDYKKIFAQRFDSEGDEIGDEFTVSVGAGNYEDPSIAATSDGFVVSYTKLGRSASDTDVYVRKYTVEGLNAVSEEAQAVSTLMEEIQSGLSAMNQDVDNKELAEQTYDKLGQLEEALDELDLSDADNATIARAKQAIAAQRADLNQVLENRVSAQNSRKAEILEKAADVQQIISNISKGLAQEHQSAQRKQDRVQEKVEIGQVPLPNTKDLRPGNAGGRKGNEIVDKMHVRRKPIQDRDNLTENAIDRAEKVVDKTIKAKNLSEIGKADEKQSNGNELLEKVLTSATADKMEDLLKDFFDKELVTDMLDKSKPEDSDDRDYKGGGVGVGKPDDSDDHGHMGGGVAEENSLKNKVFQNVNFGDKDFEPVESYSFDNGVKIDVDSLKQAMVNGSQFGKSDGVGMGKAKIEVKDGANQDRRAYADENSGHADKMDKIAKSANAHAQKKIHEAKENAKNNGNGNGAANGANGNGNGNGNGAANGANGNGNGNGAANGANGNGAANAANGADNAANGAANAANGANGNGAANAANGAAGNTGATGSWSASIGKNGYSFHKPFSTDKLA